MSINSRAFLIILDGWGINPDPAISAISAANTPFVDNLYKKYANARLTTFGEDVGLPQGQMGNSEVGHLNIGAGRVVYQDFARINRSIETGEFAALPKLNEALKSAVNGSGKIHLMGLLSDGGVHSHINHLKALCDLIHSKYDATAYIHAFTDGRDVDPNSGIDSLAEILDHIEGTDIQLASVIGRYYAMDRDHRWERIKKAYDLLVHGTGTMTNAPLDAIRQSYEAGITDEFIAPVVCSDEAGKPLATIEEGDTIIFFNFRTDRPRELLSVLTQKDNPEFEMSKINLHTVTMTTYDHTFEAVTALFTKDDLKDTLGEVLSTAGKTQLRIAETEKYPHVTFFFSGGRESIFPGEDRIMIPSPKVATYDLKPSMSALEVTDAVMQSIEEKTPDFICLNFANADMVGHTGDFNAAIEAVETVDSCLSRLVPLALKNDYGIIIIADHGNSDMMVNPDGTPNTAHTKNPVPVIFATYADGQF
ncbi:MAG: 2,3-bisphosphoglycerate-independent phosphoglycerate mutase, partial [Bacteroidetes bacterium]